MGIEDKAEFKNINLSPWFKNEELVVILLSVQSTSGIKSIIFGLVVPTGTPR